MPVQQPLGDLCVTLSKNRPPCYLLFVSHAYNTRMHIYRQHAVQIFCTRCEPKFDPSYDIRNPIVVCEPLPLQFDLNQVEERNFWSLWRWHVSRTEEERWQFMYRLLFPTDGRTVSPCELFFKTRSPRWYWKLSTSRFRSHYSWSYSTAGLFWSRPEIRWRISGLCLVWRLWHNCMDGNGNY